MVWPLTVQAVTIPTVTVGDPGNLPDLRYSTTGFGSVAYAFRIGKWEVTNSQYAEFLNSVAASDTFFLYDANMASSPHGGIIRSGSSGSFTYAVKVGMENKPVNYINWYDAIRFANWLHNGQGAGDTESGAYTLLGGTPTPSNANSITRNPGAKWWLPSEDEWYKAAYFDPITRVYYDYPTGTDSLPTATSPPGGTNSANYAGSVGSVTNVGAYASSVSPYGTSDQAGNVWEWNDTQLYPPASRGVRGGGWDSALLLPFFRGNERIGITPHAIGFRVATLVPEPGTLPLAWLACIGLLVRRLQSNSARRPKESPSLPPMESIGDRSDAAD